MVSQKIDERSLSQIRLTHFGRPIHIYFEQINHKGDDIFLSEDGLLQFYHCSDNIITTVHSEDSPAIFYTDGSVAWVQNGKYHRSDGPAIIDNATNTRQYWIMGEPILPNTDDDAEKRDESNLASLLVSIATLGTIGLLSYRGHISKPIKRINAVSSVAMVER